MHFILHGIDLSQSVESDLHFSPTTRFVENAGTSCGLSLLKTVINELPGVITALLEETG